MVDIVLAEHQGQAWLVSGERYIDDLLANTLPDDISIEFVPCVTHADVNALWLQNCGTSSASGAPWLIHPAIVNRIKRVAPRHAICFTPWSAMLDDDARTVLRAAAIRAETDADAEVVLLSHVQPGSPPAVTDLAKLRLSVIEAELVGLGVAASRLVRGSADGGPGLEQGAGGERIDIMIGSDPAWS